MTRPTDPTADSLRVLIARGKFDDAERLGRARLAERAAARDADSAAVAILLDRVVEAVWRRGGKLPQDSEAMALRALGIREARGDSLGTATALITLGRVQRSLRKLEDCRSNYARALAIRERALPENDPEIAVSLTSLGLVTREMGAFEEARALLDRAVRVREAHFGPEHVEVAKALNNLGIAYSVMGQYGRSSATLDRAVRLFERQDRVDSTSLISALVTHSASLLYLRDYSRAKEVCERALHVARALGLPENPGAIENLAVALTELGDYDGARRHYASALRLRRAGDPTGLFEIQDLINSSRVDSRTGQFDSAFAKLDEARALCGVRGAGIRHRAALWSDLADTRMRAADLEGAVTALEALAATRDSMVAGDHPDAWSARHDIAWCRWVRGDTAGVRRAQLEALSRARRFVRLACETLSEREALILADLAQRSVHLLTTMAETAGAPEERSAAWDEVIRWRSLVLEVMAGRQRMAHFATDSAGAALVERRARIARELAATIFTGRRGRPEQQDAEIARLRSEKEALEREIAAHGGTLERAIPRAEAGYPEVVRRLRPGETLVAYTRYRRADPALFTQVMSRARAEKRDALAAVATLDSDAYGAWVSSAAGPAFVALGRAATIDSLVITWRASSSDPAQARRSRRAGEALRRAIWDPLPAGARSASRVYVVADGALALLNLGALPTHRERHFMIEEPRLVIPLGAERDLIPGAPAASTAGLLAIGGVDFDADGTATSDSGAVAAFRGGTSECADFRETRFAPLPSSAAEAFEVRHAWRSGGLDSSRAHMLSGRAASEAAFKLLAPRFSTLHLATHGFFMSDRCTGAAKDDFRDAPLVRSGLVLAGANRRHSRAETEDGVLTSEEIATLDLSSVDCAVLSACGSALGTLVASEGVFGLGRAFRIAGARGLVMSLWPVDDAAARRWMSHFYRARLAGGQSVPEATRTASLELMKEQRLRGKEGSPAAWGAFVSVGADR